MEVRFWGTRGMLATPGPETVRYGGNTSAIEVRTGAGTLIVLDCGTGARRLGQALTAAGQHPPRGSILLTHTHWDHIQGLPFFAPLFARGGEWRIYAPHGQAQAIEQTLAGQMQYSYFPMTLRELGATVRYQDLTAGQLQVEEVKVTTRYLNHPGLTLGYRLECGGVTLVYIGDHEPHSRQNAAGAMEASGGAHLPAHREDQQHLEFVAGADLLIHDAQYTSAEYADHVGWGHSTMEYAVELAMAAGVRRLALFHHDPIRSDQALDEAVERARRRVADAGSALEVGAAAEGLVIELPETPGVPEAPVIEQTALVAPPAPKLKEYAAVADATPDDSIVSWLQARGNRYRTKLLVAAPDQRVVELVREALRPDGFLVMATRSGLAAMELIREHKPVLILVDEALPDVDTAVMCQSIRAEPDGALAQVPLVLLGEAADDASLAAGAPKGFTDCLAKPFTVEHVRARARGWLMGSGLMAEPAPASPGVSG
jgi:phosphoribosyl 1,2-cyclic phosphodiesterase/CheY-like chemotaxis protein